MIGKRKTPRRTFALLQALFLVLAGFAAGCASVPKRNPVPKALADRVEIPGMPLIRDWGDAPLNLERDFDAMTDAELQTELGGIYGRPHTYLALSGGGARGAYGAGILCGWTDRGDRPEFTMVTGVSTGALIAPFVFLGSEYDEVLEQAYTSTTTDDLLKLRKKINWLAADAMTKTDGFRSLLERHVDDEMIAAIATEYRRGRQLWIGTTNLESQRPVAWNIGEIAGSGDPGAAELIREVLLASAAIPGFFPPVLFDVVADGQHFDELHVDGGVTSQVFLLPGGIDWRKVLERLQVPAAPEVYVIRNARLEPEWREVSNRTIPIALNSADSLIRTQGLGDLYRIHSVALRDGMDFHLAYIPDEFRDEPEELVDPVYMRKLFDLGYTRAAEGYPWLKGPPDYRDD